MEAKEQLGALLRIRELQERAAHLGGRARAAEGVERSLASSGRYRQRLNWTVRLCLQLDHELSQRWAVSIAQGQRALDCVWSSDGATSPDSDWQASVSEVCICISDSGFTCQFLYIKFIVDGTYKRFISHLRY
nr:hypothetical protein DBT53_10340 [Aerococcus mictus]